MSRRSGRLRNKKRVNYNEDSMFKAMIKKTGRAWNDLVDVFEDKDPRPLFQKKRMFRKAIPKKVAPKVARQVVKRVAPKPRLAEIERDEREVDYPDMPEQRIERIQRRDRPILERTGRKVSKLRRRMLFMVPGDEKIMMAVFAIARNQQLPAWARRYRKNLTAEGRRLYWIEDDRGGLLRLPFGTQEELRDAVKELYFDPREPATIEPITARLRWEWANLTKRVVTRILRSLETYQLNFARRRPPDLKNRMFLYNPGMLAADMFFPSKHHGWDEYNCLTIMDTWSRYCGLYAISTKRKSDVVVAMTDFLTKFASLGHMPRRILADKGSDMQAAYEVMEPYRQEKDGNKPLVLHTATGTPVLIVEGMNAQVQRRMAIFRTSGLIESPAQILHEIADQLNNEPRQQRGGLTPLQLLALDKAGRDEINRNYRDRVIPESEIPGLPDLHVGSKVRLLKMTRKEQETNKMKGFAAKWTKRIYTVQKKQKLRKNQFTFRYDIGLADTFYRHELLKVRGAFVDQDVPNLVRYKEVSIGDEYNPADDGEEWVHSEDEYLPAVVEESAPE